MAVTSSVIASARWRGALLPATEGLLQLLALTTRADGYV